MASTVVACPGCGTRTKVPAAASGKPRCGSCKTDLPWIVAADDESFAAVSDAGKVVVLVDLWAPWCGPCRMVSPALERLARERAGRLKLVKVNVDNSPRTQARFRAQSIPTLVLLSGGKEIARQVGALRYEQLAAWVDRFLR